MRTIISVIISYLNVSILPSELSSELFEVLCMSCICWLPDPAPCKPRIVLLLLFSRESLVMFAFIFMSSDGRLESGGTGETVLLPGPPTPGWISTWWSSLQNSPSLRNANSSPGIYCFSHATQRKQSRWKILFLALITKSVFPNERQHFSHFVPNNLQRKVIFMIYFQLRQL